MNKSLSAAALWLSLSGALLAQQPAAAPATATLVSVEKIWDKGNHNAFTDLIRFQNLFYCCFRESSAHVGGDGAIRILSSFDGKTWASVAEIKAAGIDLRDPKLGVTKDDRLICFMGGSVYKGTTLMGRQPRVSTSTDGRNWSPVEKVLGDGDWLWQVTWVDSEKKFYGTVYNSSPAWTARSGSSTPPGTSRAGPMRPPCACCPMATCWPWCAARPRVTTPA